MNKVELKDLVGGALQEKFNKSFEKVIDNLQDVNTSFKVKRKISISLDFVQNEARDDVHVEVAVVEKTCTTGTNDNFICNRKRPEYWRNVR